MKMKMSKPLIFLALLGLLALAVFVGVEHRNIAAHAAAPGTATLTLYKTASSQYQSVGLTDSTGQFNNYCVNDIAAPGTAGTVASFSVDSSTNSAQVQVTEYTGGACNGSSTTTNVSIPNGQNRTITLP